ncbi:MAG: GNAT family N-acetyltransferase [Mycobacterium sp.]|nr:GNAT family N-acetyltransferase [Mycobacterium sp.]
MSVTISAATDEDVAELASVAAATFPLACPPSSTRADIAAFIAANLSAQRFAGYLTDPDREVLVARDGRILGPVLGYAMLIRGATTDPDVARAVTVQPAVELSKIYVLPDHHGAGVATALMDAAVHRAAKGGARCVWLGVNQNNQRAQRFYGKHGFTIVGTKTFTVGAALENDFVMVRPLGDGD